MIFLKTDEHAYKNYLLSKYEMWTGKKRVKSLPYYLIMDPTSCCQLHCPSCPTGVENASKKNKNIINYRERVNMKEDLLDTLIKDLGESLFFIMFYNWGEPLLSKKLPHYIRKVRDLSICTEIHSNLSLKVSDEYLEDLLSSGIDRICASIDGFSQQSYQTYRVEGDFNLAKKNIELLAKTRDRLGLHTEIVWNFLVFKFNEHEIDIAREHCERVGIEFNRREAFIVNDDWLPSYRNKPKTILKKHREENNRHKIFHSKIKKIQPCAWHYNYSVVNANGGVSPCCAPWDEKEDFGKVVPGEISFTDIWNNKNYLSARRAFSKSRRPKFLNQENICTKCPYDHDMQNLYSSLDFGVHERFYKTPLVEDRVLKECFDLLDKKKEFVEYYHANARYLMPGN